MIQTEEALYQRNNNFDHKSETKFILRRIKPEMYPKALYCGVDMVCVELEDGIAPHDKAEARKHALDLFKDDKGSENVERIYELTAFAHNLDWKTYKPF